MGREYDAFYYNRIRSPKANPKSNEEHVLQAKCFEWYHNKYISETNRKRLFAVTNNSTNKVEGNKNKALGVVAGISDMIFVAPLGVVFFIEFKTLTGVHGDEQKVFRDLCRNDEHNYITIRTEEQFKKFIHGLLGGEEKTVVN